MKKEQFRTLNQFKVLLRFSGSFNIIAASLFIFPVLFEPNEEMVIREGRNKMAVKQVA